jgi:glyoxylate reductase
VRIDEPLAGVSVWGSTIGIVGLGQIGRAVARRARAFGMQVLYHNRNRQVDAETEFNATYCPDFSELLALSDVVSLHCPLTPATHHLIDRAALSQMKPTAVLINTARGPVVDESALIECLSSGGIFAAGLDVYEHEPKVPTELMALGNVVLAPHLGTATRNARDAMGMRVIANIEAFLSTGSPGDQVTA